VSDDIPSDQIKKDTARLFGVGELTVCVHRQERGALMATQDYNWNAPEHNLKVHEKALKGEAKSHGTRQVVGCEV
jgi:hypothetical protein